jgi:pimeloyl-ACP methyl ester carboxylesterase
MLSNLRRHLLTQPSSIALLEQMRYEAILLPDRTVVETSYVQQGAGEPSIVLLHGFDSSLLEFRAIVPLLAQQHSVWAIDLLGFGFSKRQPQMAVNPTRIRQHLYQVWQQINQPIVLVGASMGGAVAIDFALHHPTCVEAVVLIDSVGFSGSFSGQWLPPAIVKFAADRRDRVLTAASRFALLGRRDRLIYAQWWLHPSVQSNRSTSAPNADFVGHNRRCARNSRRLQV